MTLIMAMQYFLWYSLFVCVYALRNLEIAWHQCAISRSRGTSAQSRDSTISIACTIEHFEFPSYIKVRDICNKLLQLRCHLQCPACILKPPYQGLLESSKTQRNSLPLGLDTSAERSQTRGVPPFKASPSLKVLNSLLLVSSDALTRLAHYVRKLHLRDLKISQMYCTIPRLHKCVAQSQNRLRNLEIGTQFRDSENAQCNLEIAQIPRLHKTYIRLLYA